MMNKLRDSLELCTILFLLSMLPACTNQVETSSQGDPRISDSQEVSLPSSGVTLRGEKVEVSAVSGHQIGHGLFKVTHSGKGSISIVIQKVVLRIGGKASNILDYHLYDLASESPLSKSGFDLGGESEKAFYVSFPRVDASFGQEIGVDLAISVDDQVYNATSPIQVIKRIPPR